MSFRRKIVGIVLTVGMVAAVSIGYTGTANATIVNDPGYKHVHNGLSGQCLMGDPETMQVQQWRCVNAPSEEWQQVPVSIPGIGGVGYLLVNEWISQCMALPNWPVNGTKIIMAPCNALDARQYWTNISTQENPFYRIISGQGSQTMCVDKPLEADNQGLQMQVWACAPQDSGLNPFFNYNTQQYWNDL